MLIFLGFFLGQNIQSMPLMKSTHECEQDVNTDGLLIQSACTEIHTFRPFSKDASGATTEVNYKLSFRRQLEGVESSEVKIYLFKRNHSTLLKILNPFKYTCTVRVVVNSSISSFSRYYLNPRKHALQPRTN